MSSSPDVVGLSLVDTPLPLKKGRKIPLIQNHSLGNAIHSKPVILDNDGIFKSSCDDRDDSAVLKHVTSDENVNPLYKKRRILNQSLGNTIHSKPVILDNDCIFKSSCDDGDDPALLKHITSDENVNPLCSCRRTDSTLEETTCEREEDNIKSKKDSIMDMEESGKDPVWILESPEIGYVLNDRCTSYSTAIKWPRITLSHDLHAKLYPHQRIGVRWLASLHHRAEKFGVGGGLLGDDMGLGKTMQTLAFIGGLFRCRTIRNALVVCPVSIVQSWKKEADKVFILCGLSSTASVMVIDSNCCSKDVRARKLDSAMKCGKDIPHLVITTYGLLTTNLADFIGTTSKRSWDYVILDEGQFIKNCTTKVHKSCSRLASYPQTRRLLLTGTPIQNNLNKELWALFDWVTRGKLLGKQRTFSKQYAIPIQRGRNKDATESNLLTAEQKNKQLQTALEPHLLQRLKEIEIKDILPWKKELVVWTHLSASQRHLYEKYLVDSGQVTAVLSGEKNSPVEAITWLKKLCAHPCLVDEQMAESCTDSLQFLKHSAKLQVLVDLVHRLNKSGHRFIIFSQSTKMLDIIEQVVPLSLARIDGQTKKNRQAIVDCFNIANSPFDGMLVSTRAGGVGLTLTGADRAIIYDPSWNPSDDMQATDRIYRIGQEHNVTIYRFIAAGTVEERMYERQVYKDGLRRTVLTASDSDPTRYFSRDELTRLFKLMPAGECNMIQRLRHDPEAVIEVSGKVSIHDKHPTIVGVSSHDSVYDFGRSLYDLGSWDSNKNVEGQSGDEDSTSHDELSSVQELIDDFMVDDSEPNKNIYDMDTIFIPFDEDSSMDEIGKNATVDSPLQEHLDTPVKVPIDQVADEEHSSNESICEIYILNTSAPTPFYAETSTGGSDEKICVYPSLHLEEYSSPRVLYENPGDNPFLREDELCRSLLPERRELTPIKEMIDESASEELMHPESIREMDMNVIPFDDADSCTRGLGENPFVCSSFQDQENISVARVHLTENEENSLFAFMMETDNSITYQNENLLSIQKSEQNLVDSLNPHESEFLSSNISLAGCGAADELMREDVAVIFDAEYGNCGIDECREDTDNILENESDAAAQSGDESLQMLLDPKSFTLISQNHQLTNRSLLFEILTVMFMSLVIQSLFSFMK